MNVSGEFQRAIPLAARRNFYDFLWMAPGTINNDNITSAAFYVNGADFGSHVIQLDGADIAAGVQSSTLYIFMGQDVLEDVQVNTGGVDASAPLGQGAIINMASQSGTNRFRTTANLIMERRSWTANNNPGGTSAAFDVFQPDISAGGPLVKNRSWMFGSYRYSNFQSNIARTADQLARMMAILPGALLPNNETISRQTFIKNNTRLSEDHQLQGFHQYGGDKRWISQATDFVRSRRGTTGGHAASVRVSSVWNNVLTSRVGMAYSNQSNPDDLIIRDKPIRPVHLNAFVSAGRLTGSGVVATLDNNLGAVWQDAPADKLTFTGDVTWFKARMAGSHEIQAGVYLNPRRLYEFDVHYANNGFTTEEVVLRDANNPSAGYIPFHRVVLEKDFVVIAQVRTKNSAVYLQDAWRPSTRLTINAGLRVDWIKRRDKIFDAVVQDTTAIGPRVGVNYLLTKDGKNVVRASYNRLHDAVSRNAGTTAGRQALAQTDSYDNDLNGTFETVIVTPAVTALTVNRVIDLKGYKQPHANEFTVGYRRQLPGQVSVDASFVRREFRNRAANIDTNGIYENGVFKGYRNVEVNEIFQLTSNTYNWPVYSAIELQVTKQAQRMQVMASYTRQFRHLAGTWQPNDPASFIQPDAFANDRGIGSQTGITTNSLSGTDMTGAIQWQDHAARIAASYTAPWDIHLATSYTFQSGPWSGPIINRAAAADPRFGPPTLTVGNRTVTNPLATLFRFAYPDRGEGQLRLKPVHTLNLRVGRKFTFGTTQIEPGFDVLNALNKGAFYAFQSGANQTFSPLYNTGTSIQPPRALQLSLRISY
jgi:hypothetical protein